MIDFIKNIYNNCPPFYGIKKHEVFNMVLHNLLPMCKGDILEIGAYEGKSTCVFLKIANEFKRKVYVVDPWNGKQQGKEGTYQQFLKNTKDYKNLEVLRLPSQDPKAVKYIQNLNLCFCLIDGLHTKEAVTLDIKTCKKAFKGKGIMVIDDTRDLYGSVGKEVCHDIMVAVQEAQDDSWQHVRSPEDWLGTCLVKS